VADGLSEWFSPYGGDDQRAVTDQHAAAADAVLLGRVTYEEFAAYWPHQHDDATGVTDYLNRTQKYVVSTTMGAAEWQNTTILRDLGGVAALKQRPGRDIVAGGSLTLVPALFEAGLVDAVRLFVHPLARGRGRRPFPAAGAGGLALEEVRRFRDGVVLLSYGVRTG